MKRLTGIMTLIDLSERLIERGHEDIFDGDILDILEIKSMTGSFFDKNGDPVIYFKIKELKPSEGYLYTVIQRVKSL